ncbi:hypothetical protein AACB35_02005 [Enterococcus faecalis]|uniref:hypothetical protein n=1 Tax=Enterococcus TaxID=1350 RepID=UPI00027C901E|nr:MULTISPECIES: hypothetical protein [Bacteria]EJG3828752.1 hypothetical protein [Listeria monocytogenes]EGO2601778.1 hypothetical protein [Enterococcus faecalis]EGO7961095.1 hypothetical protein [Enterococcus faecalis]EGO8966988.1 hypothetical protein [Enterococcus faecalis]EGO9504116.1 hypothetical protein [Enterococcus faecalis]
MTTFGEIHSNAEGYKNDFNELNKLVLRVAEEKAKGEPLVTWFRLRNRRIAQVLDPMKEEVESKSKYEKRRVAAISKSFFLLKKAFNFIEAEQFEKAEKLINEVSEELLDETIYLPKNVDSAKEEVNRIERNLKNERDKATAEIDYYAVVIKNVDNVKELFSSTRTTKEIDILTFSKAIQSINQQIDRLDIQVPALKELPETYDRQVIESLHEEIRTVVKSIDSRYTMKLFTKPLKTVRTVIHDVGNDRGRRAFQNRSNEIIEGVNEAIEIFNSKYWQITGQRWERVGRNEWGYKTVNATHPKIETI